MADISKENLMIGPNYKMVKMPMPHCPKCGDMLSGNNSIAQPYKCSCGTWGYNNWPRNQVGYYIKK